jgi:hypothetical protein
VETGGPQHTEKRPDGRGDAEPLRVTVGIVELRAIEQRTDQQIVEPGDRDAFLLGGVTRCADFARLYWARS